MEEKPEIALRDFIEANLAGATYLGLPARRCLDAIHDHLPYLVQLIPEPDNHFDPHAVGVYVDGTKVGYIPNSIRTGFKVCTECGDAMTPSATVCCTCGGTDFDESKGLAYQLIRFHLIEGCICQIISTYMRDESFGARLRIDLV